MLTNTKNHIPFMLAVKHSENLNDQPWLYSIKDILSNGWVYIDIDRTLSEKGYSVPIGYNLTDNAKLLRTTIYFDGRGKQVIEGDVYGIIEKDGSASEAYRVKWDNRGYFKLCDCYEDWEESFSDFGGREVFIYFDFIGNVNNPKFKLPPEWKDEIE